MARTTGLNATLGASGWAVPQLMDLTGHAAEHAAMGLGVLVAAPSGDATGATDSLNIATAIAAAVANGTKRVRLAGNYAVNQKIPVISGLKIKLESGSIINVADSFTVSATTTSGSKVISVASTANMKVGMLLLDEAHDLQANNPFGNIGIEASIESINSATQITATVNSTASGAITLRCYHNFNIIEADGVDDWELTCDGWAYLDGNAQSHGYPYTLNSHDGYGNGLRIKNSSGFYVDGIQGQNNRFHGAICVGKLDRYRIGRYRGYSNGYRAMHFHSETGTYTDPRVTGHYELIESDTNGWQAFHTHGDDSNTGIFLVFSNVTGQTCQTLRSSNDYGIGVALSGHITADAYTPGKYNQVGQIHTEHAGIGLYLANELEAVETATAIIRGDVIRIYAAQLIDAADTIVYRIKTDGTTQAYGMRRVQLPAGSVSAYNIRAGMRIVCPGTPTGTGSGGGATGYSSSGGYIDRVEVGAGAGGTDIAWVFNAGGGANPYTNGAATSDMWLYTSRSYGVQFSEASAKVTKNIKFGEMTIAGQNIPFGTSYDATQVRVQDLSIGALTINGSQSFVTFASIADMKIGKLKVIDANIALPGVSTPGVGSYDVYMRNCANWSIDHFTVEKPGSPTGSSEAMRIDADCRNGRLSPMGVKKPNSGALTINCLVTAGAGANTAGYSGPIIIYNPTATDGSALTSSLTGAGGNIERTNANACIINRSTDTP